MPGVGLGLGIRRSRWRPVVSPGGGKPAFNSPFNLPGAFDSDGDNLDSFADTAAARAAWTTRGLFANMYGPEAPNPDAPGADTFPVLDDTVQFNGHRTLKVAFDPNLEGKANTEMSGTSPVCSRLFARLAVRIPANIEDSVGVKALSICSLLGKPGTYPDYAYEDNPGDALLYFQNLNTLYNILANAGVSAGHFFTFDVLADPYPLNELAASFASIQDQWVFISQLVETLPADGASVYGYTRMQSWIGAVRISDNTSIQSGETGGTAPAGFPYSWPYAFRDNPGAGTPAPFHIGLRDLVVCDALPSNELPVTGLEGYP